MLVDDSLQKLLSDGVNINMPELIRYKGIARRLNLQPASAIRSSMAGAMSSKFKGRGMEFDEARHYQPGDDIRSIDWRVTARTGKTHTKLYREERERPVLIYIDLHASMHFGTQLLYKSVQAIHSAALISFSALSRGDKIGCVAINESCDIELKPKATSKHVLGMLNQVMNMHNDDVQQLAHKRATSDPALSSQAGLTKLAMLAKPGTLVYIISDFTHFNQQAFDVIGKMQRHCEIRPLQIFDPIEHALPVFRGLEHVLLSDGQQEQAITLGDKTLASEYQQTRKSWFESIAKNLQRHNVHLRSISAASPIEDQLIASKRGLDLGVLV